MQQQTNQLVSQTHSRSYLSEFRLSSFSAFLVSELPLTFPPPPTISLPPLALCPRMTPTLPVINSTLPIISSTPALPVHPIIPIFILRHRNLLILRHSSMHLHALAITLLPQTLTVASTTFKEG